MSEFEAAIFDLDGTLLESMGVWTEIDAAFLQKRGFEATEDYIRAVTPMGFRPAAEYTISRFGLEESPDEIMAEWDLMCRDAYAHTIGLKPDAEVYLRRLKQGGVKLGVATALTPELFRPALERNGVLSLFDAFTSLGEVRRGKGFPDIYLLTAQKLGVAPGACMVFEDISLGIAGAQAGGFLTCGVYDDSSAHEWDKIRETAHRTIRHYRELL